MLSSIDIGHRQFSKAMKKATDELGKGMERNVTIATLSTEREAKMNVRNRKHVRTGTGIRRITSKVKKDGLNSSGRVGTDYAPLLFIHEGTGIYGPKKAPIFIKPRTAGGVLAWPKAGTSTRGSGNITARVSAGISSGRKSAGGTFNFSRGHYIRGIQPDPWLHDAYKKIILPYDWSK